MSIKKKRQKIVHNIIELKSLVMSMPDPLPMEIVLIAQLLFKLCQGFIKLHSGPGLNRLQPKGLKEYSDSYLISDYLRPVLGSKWLILQTIGNHLGLSWTQTFRGDLGEDVSGCHLDF
jgi:hypothetical protein